MLKSFPLAGEQPVMTATPTETGNLGTRAFLQIPGIPSQQQNEGHKFCFDNRDMPRPSTVRMTRGLANAIAIHQHHPWCQWIPAYRAPASQILGSWKIAAHPGQCPTFLSPISCQYTLLVFYVRALTYPDSIATCS